VAQGGAEDASFLAPVPAASGPIGIATSTVEDAPPADAPTPLSAADAVIKALADPPAEPATDDAVSPGETATGE
jgi:hypothetical protein